MDINGSIYMYIKWIIALMEKMEKLGFANNVIRTPKERIMTKFELTKKAIFCKDERAISCSRYVIKQVT